VPAPIITTPPRHQAVAVGSTVTFSAVARGATPIRYQWRWNGTSLAGATNANLVLSNVQFDQAGTYSVEIANNFGIIASPEATLTVQEPPIIATQAISQTVFSGQTVRFKVAASGAPPLQYQWLFNAAPIPGATNATLALSHVQLANAGHYAVTVSNAASSVTSEAATLMVVPVPTGAGSVDITFDPTRGGELIGLGGQWLGDPWERPMNAVILQPDGKFVIGGSFIGVNARPRNNFARLNSDGSLDLSFDSSWGADGEVTWIARQADGKILLTGWFTSVNGVRRDRIARLNPDGSLDIGFNPASGLANAHAERIVLLPKGCALIVADRDFPADRTQSFYLLGADDTIEPVFNILIQPDDKILVDSSCTVDGAHWPGPVRLNTDGSLDRGFHAAVSGAWKMALQPDGKVLVVHGNSVVRLNPDGSLDARFQAEPGNGSFHAIALQSDGQLLVGGYFASVNGIPRGSIARLNNDVAWPFVARQLPSAYQPGVTFTLQLNATPASSVSVYAVEDQPPPDWIVMSVSHAGIFDAHTGKVKFGPFFDSAPRTGVADAAEPNPD
jgi:uncharacterized delta-60 repeat protein